MRKLWHGFKLTVFYFMCYMLALCLALSLFVVGKRLTESAKNTLKQRCIHLVIRWVRFLFNIRIKIENRETLPAGPCVVMANHQSSFETLFLQLLCEPMSVVLKKELVQSAWLRQALSIADPVPLDRSKPAQAYRDLLKEGAIRLQKQRSVLIFPEGTRVKVGGHIKLNRGAASLAHRAQVPLVPVAHNAGLCWPPRAGTKYAEINVRIGAALDTRTQSLDEIYQASSHWLIHNRDALLSGSAQAESEFPSESPSE